jgi:DnaJ-class molecular chaperone
MRNPYTVLGVSPNASADEIKKAYRALAKANHPDIHKGNKEKELKFKEISAAYTFLDDKDKRAQFDRGEIGADGQPTGFGGGFNHQHGGFKHTRTKGQGRGQRPQVDEMPFDPEEIFNSLFGGGASAKQKHQEQPTMLDTTYTITLTLEEAVHGGKKSLKLTNGKTISITIPKGAKQGQTLRLKGQGATSSNGLTVGDALVKLTIEPHGYFKIEGDDIHLTLPISLKEAVLGATITIPTVYGTVAIKVPPYASAGTILRLKGKGVSRDGKQGDQLCTLNIVLPTKPDNALSAFVKTWEGGKEEVRGF